MRVSFKSGFDFIAAIWKKHPHVTLTVLYFIGAVLVTDNKVFFAWSVAFFISMYVVTNSYFEALIYSFFPFLAFNIGQLYQFIVVPPHQVFGISHQGERSLYVTLSPFYLLQIVLIVSVPLLMLRFRKKLHFSAILVWFSVILFSSLYSAFNSTLFPVLSMLYSVLEFGLLSWGIIIISYLRKKGKSAVLLNILLFQIVVLLSFHSSVVFLQTVKRSTLGLKIEQTGQIPYFGAGADENVNQFRPIGLRGDANTLANEFLLLSSMMVLLWLYLVEQKKLQVPQKVLSVVLISSLLVIIITQCRSVYLGLAGAFIIVFMWQRNQMLSISRLLLKRLEPFRYTLFLLFFVLTLLVGDRLWRSQFSFSESGGYTVRVELLKEAQNVIQQNWWWGVGPAMFIPAAYQNNPLGVMSYFPEAVHNGFYLFWAERGTVTSLSVVILFYWITKKIWQMKIGSFFKWVYASTLIAQFIAMLFQPFNNFMTSYIILLIIMIEVYSYD
jgi:hypothetical protein